MSRVTDEALKRLASAVRQRRHELQLTQPELAAASGTTDRLIRGIELGESRDRHPATYRAISVALGWTGDSIDRILAGKDPVMAEDEPDADSARDEVLLRLDRLESLVRELLDRSEPHNNRDPAHSPD